MSDLMAQPPDLMLARARAELGHVTQSHAQLFGLDRADWSIDLSAGRISFATQGWPQASAPIQIVGTRNAEDGSWLWGWDHPSGPSDLRAAAEACRRYGDAWGLPEYLSRKVECSAAQAWDFAAVARRLHGHEGAYCATAAAEIYLTYGRVSLSPVRPARR